MAIIKAYALAAIAASVGVNTPEKIPITKMTGVSRAIKAELKEEYISRNFGVLSPLGYFLIFARKATVTIKARPIKQPGIKPPSKSFPTDAEQTTPAITMDMLGGITGPIQAEDAVTAAENGAS